MTLTCFKSYDVRGRLGPKLNKAIAHGIGRSFARSLDARRVVLARDTRATARRGHLAVLQSACFRAG